MIRLGTAILLYALCLATSCVLRAPTLTARTSLPIGVGGDAPVSGPGPAPADAPPDDNQLIEAGCSFNANEIKADPGTVHRVSCPAGCAAGSLWGSDTYTGDSPICRAAIHAGLTTERGGEFTLILEDGRPAYRGSKRNGIRSADYGAYRSSFRLRR